MTAVYDTIVLGCGGMGSAALAALARRGQRVLGLEQYEPLHNQGSSHGRTRIIRLAYFEHADYVPLLREAYDRWYALEQLVGRQLLTECGLLNIGPADSATITGVRTAVAAHHLAIEEYSAAEIHRRWPQFRLPADYVALYESVAGYLRVEDCVAAHLQVARSCGAELLSSTTVLGWERSGSGLLVRTTAGDFSCAHLVVTAGGWAGSILAAFQLPLTVMRQAAAWFRPVDASAASRQHLPCYFIETDAGEYYGFPAIDGDGCKLARHYGAPELSSPAEIDRTFSDRDELPLRTFAERYLPGMIAERMTGSVCLYTLTPDRHFIIDHAPGDERVSIAAGFSGHGFKFASLVGDILADLAIDGATQRPIGFLRATRFAAEERC